MARGTGGAGALREVKAAVDLRHLDGQLFPAGLRHPSELAAVGGDAEQLAGGRSGPDGHPVVAAALGAMRSTLDRPLRLAELAHRIGCGRSLLARCFRAEVGELAAEVERLRAALAVSEQATAPTRGSLINALASAGAARVEAEARLARAEVAYKHQPHAAQREALAAAQVAVGVAHAEEQKARAALDAWESADREADPCPGSRGF